MSRPPVPEPPCITKMMPAGHLALRTVRYGYDRAFEICGSLHLGAPSGDARLDAKVLTMGRPANSKASEVKHVVFETDPRQPEPAPQAIARYKLIIADWLATYAPGFDWVVAFHRKNGRIHPHLIVAGFTPDGKPLRIRPDQVKEMATMKFTTHARNAAGIGTPGLGFYSKPRSPLKADLIREASGEQLYEWIKNGTLGVGRRDKKGVITSVEWDSHNGKKPRRISLDTIQRRATDAAAKARGDFALLESGTAIDTGLGRRRRPRHRRQSAGHRGERRERRSLGRGQQQDYPLLPQQRSGGFGLLRDVLPGSKLAQTSLPRADGRSGRPAPVSVHALRHAQLFHLTKTKDTTMPMHSAKPEGPLPSDVKKNLAAAGFSDEAINDFFNEVREAHRQLEQIEKEKTPTVKPSTPSLS